MGLDELWALFLNNLLPVFLAASAGYLLARLLKANPRGLSQVTFYILSPCLVFNLIVQSELSNGDILRMSSFVLIMATLVGLITWVIVRALRFERRTQSAVLITSIFMNAGNLGLPVTTFAFGEQALAYASVFFVASAMLVYTLGVVLASMGTAPISKALVNLLKVPAFYALILALLFLWAGWRLPVPIQRTTDLLGSAAIPAMLVLLGMQLVSVNWVGKIAPLAVATVVRLILSPILALMLSGLLGMQGAFRQAAVLEAAMPAAVLTTVLATEYDTDAPFVTSVVFVTTLLSMVTLTLLLAYLGG